MKLKFELANDKKYSNGVFETSGMKIIPNGDAVEVEYDDMDLYLDGQLYESGITDWTGRHNYSTDELFEQVLSAYLRHDNSAYKNFDNAWYIFSDLSAKEQWDGDLLIKFPVYDMGTVSIYELQLATPEYRYYTSDDEFLMLDANGGIVTDMENFYSEAIFQDIKDILLGNTECLYKGYDFDAIIEDFGGEKGFLEEFE